MEGTQTLLIVFLYLFYGYMAIIGMSFVTMFLWVVVTVKNKGIMGLVLTIMNEIDNKKGVFFLCTLPFRPIFEIIFFFIKPFKGK